MNAHNMETNVFDVAFAVTFPRFYFRNSRAKNFGGFEIEGGRYYVARWGCETGRISGMAVDTLRYNVVERFKF